METIVPSNGHILIFELSAIIFTKRLNDAVLLAEPFFLVEADTSLICIVSKSC
jgi:hypothetical protein